MNHELAEFTFRSRYAQYRKEDLRRENWSETCDRVEQFFKAAYFDKPAVFPYINFAMSHMRRKNALPAQRLLQFAGAAVFHHNARAYNCWTSYCDRLRFFQEAFYILLCGGGVGFSVQKQDIEKLPSLSKNKRIEEKVYSVPDSIEGWSDSVGVLLSTYFENPEFPEYANCKVVFDYSQIRPEGSEFSHGVGRAPGHKGLEAALERIRGLLDRTVAERSRLRPIDAYDIVMHTSDAVLSGGVRRSSCIALFSIDDEEMMQAKTGNWFIENPQRARSNNSVVCVIDEVTWEQFARLEEFTKQYGEPGFLWVHSNRILPNPCVEILMYPVNRQGVSGWQACNLSTQNALNMRNANDFCDFAKAAAIFGTLQAGLTQFDYLGKVTEEIVADEALIGVSITGMMANPNIVFNPENQRRAARVVKQINTEVAHILGINCAARLTCVKPEGTSTPVLGLGSFAGCHAGKGKRFIRHVQENKLNPIAQAYQRINPYSVEDSVWSANNTDIVIGFCYESPEGSIQEKDLGALEFLEYVKLTQQNWVAEGVNPKLCRLAKTHNVSNTVVVKHHEWDKVWRYLYDNRNSFAAVSFLSETGDKDYPQAPFVEILLEEEILEKFNLSFEFGLEYLHRHHIQNLWDHNLDVSTLANEYFSGNNKIALSFLRHVYYLAKWNTIHAKYQPMNYDSVIERSNNTVGSKEIACAGGACLI